MDEFDKLRSGKRIAGVATTIVRPGGKFQVAHIPRSGSIVIATFEGSGGAGTLMIEEFEPQKQDETNATSSPPKAPYRAPG